GTDHGFIALIYFQKGLALEQLGQLAAAEKAYRACLQTGLKTVGGAHPKVLVVLDRLAYLLGRQNHVPDAKQLLAANLQVRRDQLEKDDLGLAEILELYGTFLQVHGGQRDAAALFAEAVPIFERNANENEVFRLYPYCRCLASHAQNLVGQGKVE